MGRQKAAAAAAAGGGLGLHVEWVGLDECYGLKILVGRQRATVAAAAAGVAAAACGQYSFYP